ncbi:peptidase S8/S53 domain-containing protein [Catenaria anguillulae PL171]|uniref:Peptidase S8/S53 domain-containing protein n=1 Tax=Catenaria anguillulae PL171 TaxID=765915 RepID=A0A1Y2HK17_9FUNG|nr:peptidase S8/S53 domain-containing protein [Catenaria anguillulae PL171]
MATTKPKRFMMRSILLALILSALALGANSQDVIRQAPSGAQIAEGRYIVQFTRAPAVQASLRNTRESASLRNAAQAQQESFNARARALPKVKIERSFTKLFNGVSIRATKDQIVELSKVAGVKAIYPVLLHSFDPMEVTPNADPAKRTDLSSSHNATGVARVREELKLTGKGIRIAIIDSGVDYRHPAFARPGQTCPRLGESGCRVIKGVDIVGDDWNPADPLRDVVKPDDDPDDCISGHGTHVAGISAGADNVFTGVAPDADILAYKVFGCTGPRTSTTTDAMVAAMERATDDGAHVINMSIGGGAMFDDWPTAQAATALADKGVIVVSSQGNNGPKGLFWGGAPGAARRGFGTGSADAPTTVSSSLTVTGLAGATEIAFNNEESTAGKFTRGTAFAIKNSPNAPTTADDGCNAFPAGTFTGKVALVRRGTCAFAIKAENARVAGATGVLVYNNAPGMPGLFSGSITPAGFAIPVGYVSGVDGERLWAAANTGAEVTIANNGGQLALPNLVTGGQPSDFTSWGPGPTLVMKPDVIAPGGNIYSSYPRRQGSYASLSGTSMASPYLAGVSALFREAFPEVFEGAFDQMQRRVQNTAEPVRLASTGLPWPVPRQGAGYINAYNLLTNRVAVTPSKLELGDGNDRKTREIRVSNTGSQTIAYTLSHQPATSVNQNGAPLNPIFSNTTTARVSISAAQITLRARESARVQIEVFPNPGQGPFWLQSGWVVLTPSEGSPAGTPTLRVPYLLMTGDYSQYAQLPADPTRSPVIADSDLSAWDPASTGPRPKSKREESDSTKSIGPYSLNGTDIPLLYVEPAHINRNMRIEVFNATNKQRLGLVADYPYTQPNRYLLPSANSTLLVGTRPLRGWQGEYFESETSAAKVVPDGDYYFELSFVRPGKSNDGWETRHAKYWTSPRILIRRDGGASTTTSTTTAAATTTTTAAATTTTSAAATTTSSAATTATTTSGAGSSTANPTVPTDLPVYGRRPRPSTPVVAPEPVYGRRPTRPAVGGNARID